MNYFNYYTEIEDTFIRRRGKHLLLSPLDWALIESWKKMGVPLHVALRGIEQSFDSFEARPRRRSVKSLLYCQEEVEAQFAEWLEGQRGSQGAGAVAETNGAGASESKDAGADSNGKMANLPFPREVIASHLAAARESVARAANTSARGGELVEALGRAAGRLEELERDFAQAVRPDAEQLESSLTDLEALIDRALRAALTTEALASARARAGEQLLPYRSRMERAVYEQTLDNLLAKLLREERGLPRLSLFYL
jgi:hypothetical protein